MRLPASINPNEKNHDGLTFEEQIAAVESGVYGGGTPRGALSPDVQAKIDTARAARADARRSLPCFERAQTSVHEAVDACIAKGGRNGCVYWRDPALDEGYVPPGSLTAEFQCPRVTELQIRTLRAKSMDAANVPTRQFLRVLLDRPCRHMVDDWPSYPLDETDAIKLAVAFAAGEPATVCLDILGGKPHEVTGSEWALVLGGRVGTGKSLAAALAVAKYGGAWLRAQEIAKIGDEDDPKHPFNIACVSTLLVIDDLADEYAGSKGWAVARVSEVLSLRHSEGRKTIITTNLTEKAQIDARYGSRVVDRLSEGGIFAVFPGESLRGKDPAQAVLDAEAKRQGLLGAAHHGGFYRSTSRDVIDEWTRAEKQQRKRPSRKPSPNLIRRSGIIGPAEPGDFSDIPPNGVRVER